MMEPGSTTDAPAARMLSKEFVLMASNWITDADGDRDISAEGYDYESFGNGRVFMGYYGRPYIAFGAKDNDSHLRTIFFKELTLDPSTTSPPACTGSPFGGRLLRLYNGHDDREQDLNTFRIPNPAEFNGDGFVDGIDASDFANLFTEGDPSTDVNGDGFVDGIDADIFNLFFDGYP